MNKKLLGLAVVLAIGLVGLYLYSLQPGASADEINTDMLVPPTTGVFCDDLLTTLMTDAQGDGTVTQEEKDSITNEWLGCASLSEDASYFTTEKQTEVQVQVDAL